MSYTFRYKGIGVTCDTIEELREAVQGLAEDGGDDSPDSTADKPRSTPAPPKSQPGLRKNRPAPKHRGVADSTYLKYGWRVVRSLLAATEVGKLRVSLAKEFNINKTMMEAIIGRLSREQPSFLMIHQEQGRGISPFIRLTSRPAAEAFANQQEQLYKEQLAAELKAT